MEGWDWQQRTALRLGDVSYVFRTRFIVFFIVAPNRRSVLSQPFSYGNPLLLGVITIFSMCGP